MPSRLKKHRDMGCEYNYSKKATLPCSKRDYIVTDYS